MKKLAVALLLIVASSCFAQQGPVFNTPPRYNANNAAITGGTINNTVIGGTTPAAGTFTHADISGTAGNGYLGIVPQSSAPSAPATGLRLYADATGRLSWIRPSDGFSRTFDATLTASRVYTLPDATTTLVGTDTTQTLTTKTLTAPALDGAATFSTATVARGTAANMGTWYAVCQSGAAVSGAADTNENTVYTCTIPANSLGPNGSIRVATRTTVNNNANVKTWRIRYSGASGTQYYSNNFASLVSVGVTRLISNRNATNSQIGGVDVTGTFESGTATAAHITSAVDTTGSTTIVVTCQKATSGDTCTLEHIIVHVIFGA